MIGNIILLLSAIEAVVGGLTGSQCCASKTVGDKSYTLVETDYAVPEECLNACTYTRDDQPGSLYCFAKGELPVQCTAENPVSMCYKGCGPDFNTKIVNSTPIDVSTRPTYYDCWDYCRARCTELFCTCHAWSYDEPSETCYTYPGPFHCHQTVFEEGWVSGGLCFGNNTRPILEAENVPGTIIDANVTSTLTLGDLVGATIAFTDEPFSTAGKITKVTMYKGKFFTIDDVIVGIQITYGTSTKGALHGKQTNESMTCEFQPNAGNPIVNIYGSAVNNHANNALIYSLGFNQGFITPTCIFGNIAGGNQFKQEVKDVEFITGFTTETAPVLGQITFHYTSV